MPNDPLLSEMESFCGGLRSLRVVVGKWPGTSDHHLVWVPWWSRGQDERTATHRQDDWNPGWIHHEIRHRGSQWRGPNIVHHMMTSWHGNALHITGPLWGESTGHRWIPLTKGQWCGFSLMLGWKAVEQIVELLVIWDAMKPMWRHGDELRQSVE